MRVVSTTMIGHIVEKLCAQANFELTEDVQKGLSQALSKEETTLGRDVLRQLGENLTIARDQKIAICQDTGMVVVFLEIGQQVVLEGEYLEEQVNKAVARAYQDNFLRQSVVSDPLFDRENTGDNTPAVLHVRIVPGDRVRIIVCPKGFGSENMSALKMLRPAEGVDGLKEFVYNTVADAGGSPCPPIVVGVGVGGTMEKAALLAKWALTRPVGRCSPAPRVAELESELLAGINRSGIGPQGFGGTTTALAVHVETFPTHIAGLPVAVNLCCHVYRHREAVL